MITLYDYWRSTAAYRVRIALNWKNIPFKLHQVHLVSNGGEQHSASYKEVNSSELVPTLELECGTRMSQSLAILQYLEDQYPANPLLPEAGPIKYQALELSTIIGCDLHPLNNLRVLQYLAGSFDIDKEGKDRWYRHWVETGFAAIEKKLELWDHQGPFALGEQFTWADIYITAQVYNAERFEIGLAQYPLLEKSASSSRELDAVKQAFPQS